VPNGDVAEIFDQALTLLVDRLERRKLGAAKHPRVATRESPSGPNKRATSRKRSRHIPAAVKREVWRRDAGCCSYVAASGQRYGETGFLEYHHRRPVGDGGETTVENTALYCRVHNQREGERYFGFTREPIAAMVAAASRGDDAGGHDQNDGAREHVSKHARESAVAPTQDPRKSSASGP
jgi:5-methylcytosine-specific restriction endonuclease McrA